VIERRLKEEMNETLLISLDEQKILVMRVRGALQ
jgi:hypothetical protein